MRTSTSLAALLSCLTALTPAALADPMGLWTLPIAAGQANAYGPSTLPGTQYVSYAALGSVYLTAPNTLNGDGFLYSFMGADYATNFTISYTIVSNATTTTITGMMTLTNQLGNATSTLAYIDSFASFTLPIEIYQPCNFTSTYWSPTGDPALATAAYSSGGAFCNPTPYSPITALPSFGASGAAAVGQYGFGGTIASHLEGVNFDFAPQTVTLNFQITATVPAPGAAMLLGLGGVLSARRRRI